MKLYTKRFKRKATKRPKTNTRGVPSRPPPREVVNGITENLNPDNEIDQIIEEMFTEVNEAEGEAIGSHDFRPSSFPYCPILDMENRVSNFISFKPSYRSEFYTKIGTAVHENLQYWLPSLKKWETHIWGDWACTGCGEKDKFGEWKPQKSACYKPAPCNCSAKEKYWQYLEIAFTRGEPSLKAKRLIKKGLKPGPKDRLPIGGHVDLVFLINNEFVVIDFKTAGLSKLEKPNWKKHFPSHNYTCQINTYCTLFPLKYGKQVRSWSLVFVGRDNVSSWPSRKPLIRSVSHKLSNYDRSIWSNRLWKAEFGRKKVENLLETGETKFAKQIVLSRPCRKKYEYENWMKSQFYNEECPHFVSGKCALPTKFGNGMVERVEFLAEVIEQKRRTE